MATAAAWLEPWDDARVVLEDVTVQGQIQGLTAEIVLTQTYRNTEERNIEAVYTFPLPLDAVLLELSLTLNGETLKGTVHGRSEAEEAYEDAVDEGHSAVLLERAAPGLYSVNVANLLAGETAKIRIRYAQLLRWQGRQLRFQLPTTIAPRYGDAVQAGLQPHQVPETSLLSGAHFGLELTITGSLSALPIASPSHSIQIGSEPAGAKISLTGNADILDRDFVLNFSGSTEATSDGVWAKDGDSYVALASFRLPPRSVEVANPRNLVVVIDCSGSMTGDSIAQAKTAVQSILTALEPTDTFNIIAFGSSHITLFPEPLRATTENLESARSKVHALDANLGGTEMADALRAAYKQARHGAKGTNVLLISDGEVWDDGSLQADAINAGARVFAVGVGSAAAESTLMSLSESTGGVAEFIVPREDMAEKITRHFGRIDQPIATDVALTWPSRARWQIPDSIPVTFAGDTLHVFANLESLPESKAHLRLRFEDGSTLEQSVEFDEKPADRDWLPRIAASRRIRTLTASEAQDLAVEYQLVTEYSSCVLVKERSEGEKATEPPKLRKIQQTLAAGWGGFGSDRSEVLHAPASRAMYAPDRTFSRRRETPLRTSSDRVISRGREVPRPDPINFIDLESPRVIGQSWQPRKKRDLILHAVTSAQASGTLKNFAHFARALRAAFPALGELPAQAGIGQAELSHEELCICLLFMLLDSLDRHRKREVRHLLKGVAKPTVLDSNPHLKELLSKFLESTGTDSSTDHSLNIPPFLRR